MKNIKLSNKNFKRFEKFTNEWIMLRQELMLNTRNTDAINDMANHVMFDVAYAIERAE